MKKNIRNIGILAILLTLIISGTTLADGRSNISGELLFETTKTLGSFITERDLPAFYTEKSNYLIKVAVFDVAGNSSDFQEVPVGKTYNFGSPSTIKGPNQVITFKAKNAKWHWSNSFSGIMFY